MHDLQKEKAELVSLVSLPGVGTKKVGELLSLFGSPAGAWEAVRIGAADGVIQAGNGDGCRDVSNRMSPRKFLDSVESGGIKVAVRGGPGYPAPLGEIHDPPWVLFFRGRKPPPSAAAVAVVGSRKSTPYGLEAARWLAGGLAGAGVNVVSGAAYGVDTAAHRGALDEGGFTTAVLGCGVDVVYPRSSRALFRDIESQGCLLAEYPPGTEPNRYHFPARNRIIAGMSSAVVVVEASEKSGALITAGFAASEGREVMAVPGGVFSFNSRGSNELIRSGAVPVTCPEDILIEIGVPVEKVAAMNVSLDGRHSDAGPEEKALLDAISGGLSYLEDLSGSAGISAAEAVSALSRMEVGGLVTRGPGGRYYLRAPLRG